MKVSLVVAPMLFRRCPLIGVAYLAAALRARGHNVSVLDINAAGEPLPREGDEDSWEDPDFTQAYISSNQPALDAWAGEILRGDPDVVGFSVWQTNRALTIELAELVKRRKPGCLVVFGGPHTGFESWQLLLQSAAPDVLILGEGENTMAEVVELYRAGGRAEDCPGTWFRRGGAIARARPAEPILDLDSIPFPDYSGFPLKNYCLPTALPISFSRGCVRRCAFCNIHSDWPVYRHRSAGSILREMRHMLASYPGTDHFVVDCAAVNQDIGRLDSLCGLILKSGLKFGWGGMAMFRPEMTGELLGKMAAAGCRDLSYGLESGSQRVLNSLRKGFLLEHAAQCLRNTRRAGIEVSLNLIIGSPGETEEDLKLTMDFLLANRENIDFVGCPSELTLVHGIPMQKRPGEFGIDPGDSAVGHEWTAGENTHAVRKDRVRRFNEFLAAEGIGRYTPQGRARTVSGGDGA